MVFSSLPFLFVFLPLFLLFYCLLPWRNFVALMFSLLFYAWGEGLYVALLLLVIACNHQFGRYIVRRPGVRWVLGLAVAFNVLVLAYFKYAGFVLVGLLGLQVAPETLPRLPLGISFFIFQSISYLVDVYRRQAPVADSLADLALYIAMFPQLVAGPIVRYASVADLLRQREISLENIRQGCCLFVFGLCQKVLIANNVGEVADKAFATPPAELGQAMAWVGTLAYSLQIFHDFAGYSLMAIGLGCLMGFRFPDNFNYPYISSSITEFWRRWHMSLSSWFRDYLYIPLGGNRRGRARTLFNLYVVFLLCGLWHGAAWTFVAWGAYHGTWLVIERLGLGRVLARLPGVVGWAYATLVVMTGWVLFRAESFVAARDMLHVMWFGSEAQGLPLANLASHENLLWGLLGMAFSLPLWRWCQRLVGQRKSPVASGQPWFSDAGRGTALAVFLLVLFAGCCTYIYAGSYNPFIYFRF